MVSLTDKLKEKVCQYAHLPVQCVNPAIDEWLGRRVHQWVQARRSCDADLRLAATDLRQAFPGLPVKERLTRSVSQMQAQHVNDCNTAGNNNTNNKNKSYANDRSKTTEPHSAASPNLSDIAVSGGGIRPQVIRRLQRLNDDAEFVQAFERQNEHLEHEKEQLVREKRLRQEKIQREMQAAEELRVRRIHEERMEKERLHRMVDDMMKESKLQEQDEKIHRTLRMMEEKKSIELQSEIKRRIKEEADQRIAAEQAAREAYNLQREREKMFQEIDKSVQLKNAMVAALEEGKVALQSKEQMKKQKMLPSNQEGGVVSSPMFDIRSGKEEGPKARVHLREQLQSVVSSHYAELLASKKQQLERMDHQVMEQRMKQLKEVEEREFRDRQRAQKLRANLVSSLDEELSIQRTRQMQAEAEKRDLRRMVDADAEEAQRKRQQHALDIRRQQEERRHQMDQQLASRVQLMIQPIAVKI